jgi:hypothetical protein
MTIDLCLTVMKGSLPKKEPGARSGAWFLPGYPGR